MTTQEIEKLIAQTKALYDQTTNQTAQKALQAILYIQIGCGTLLAIFPTDTGTQAVIKSIIIDTNRFREIIRIHTNATLNFENEVPDAFRKAFDDHDCDPPATKHK